MFSILHPSTRSGSRTKICNHKVRNALLYRSQIGAYIFENAVMKPRISWSPGIKSGNQE